MSLSFLLKFCLREISKVERAFRFELFIKVERALRFELLINARLELAISGWRIGSPLLSFFVKLEEIPHWLVRVGVTIDQVVSGSWRIDKKSYDR